MTYDLLSMLSPLAEPSYRDFHVRLVPELSAGDMLGVRLPALRKLAGQLAAGPDARAILDDRTPDRYYEETIVRGAVIGAAKLPLTERLQYIADFVPYITNWAICDAFVSGLRFKKAELPAVRAFLAPYLESAEEFPARFGAVMLLRFFVRADCITDTLTALTALPAPGYNAQMAAAWALAECLVKFPDETLAHLKLSMLSPWTYRKTLQKALESRRLPDELRPVLKALRKEIQV